MTQAEFDWAQDVRVSVTAPADYRPGQVGSICGITRTSEDASLSEPAGTMLYLIEFADGSSVEVPGAFLDAWP